MKRTRLREYLLDGLAILAGSIIFGISVNVFTLPGGFVPGGATGVAVILNRLSGLPVGAGIILVNIPLFAVSLKRLGGAFFVKTAIATAATGVAADLLAFLPAYTQDRLLGCIFGALAMGVGLALIFLRGIMTGGSDLVSQLIRAKRPHLGMGRLLLIIDGIIVLAGSLLVYRDLTGAFYSFIMLFITSAAIDWVLSRTERGSVCFIVSKLSGELENEIQKKLGRGATVLHGRGSYYKTERDVIMCAVRPPELARLRSTVYAADPAAFFIVTEASEISGQGFSLLG